MTITAKNSREVYIVMIIIFAIGLAWNTYYVHRIADERTEILNLENKKINAEVEDLNTMLDSAQVSNYRLAQKYFQLTQIMYTQDDVIKAIEKNYEKQFKKLKDYDEASYIPDVDTKQHIEFLSSYKYSEY